MKMVAVTTQEVDIHEKQAEFRSSDAFMRGYVGGRGCGKTKVGALDCLMRAQDGDSGMIVSETNGRIEETTYPAIKETAIELDQWIRGRVSFPPKIWIKTQDGGKASFVFYSGEKPDSLRGPTKSMLWIDEASIQCQEVLDYGLPVLRLRKDAGGNKAILTFTPKGTRHWTFNTFYIEVAAEELENYSKAELREFNGRFYKLRKNRQLIHAHTLDNPFLPDDYYDNIREQYSSALAAQELEGLFVELAGLMFHRQWFEIVDEAPVKANRIRYWDKAGTAAADNPAAAYSAGVKMAEKDGIYYIEDVKRGQWSSDDRNKVMKQVSALDAQRHRNNVQIWFEQEGGSGGKESAELTIKMLAQYPVHRDVVSGKRHRSAGGEKLPGEAKIVRAGPWCAQAEAGNIKLVHGPWNEDFLAEVCAFPEYAFMDQVDATSGAFNKLAKRKGHGEKPPEHVPMAMPAKGQYGVHLVRGEQTRGARRPQTRRIRR